MCDGVRRENKTNTATVYPQLTLTELQSYWIASWIVNWRPKTLRLLIVVSIHFGEDLGSWSKSSCSESLLSLDH